MLDDQLHSLFGGKKEIHFLEMGSLLSKLCTYIPKTETENPKIEAPIKPKRSKSAPPK